MFQLDYEVNKWCHRLRREAHLNDVQIEELSDHLYTEIRRQQEQNGWTREQAFNYAVNQLGSITALGDEYHKNHGFRRVAARLATFPYLDRIFAVYLIVTGTYFVYWNMSHMLYAFNRDIPIDITGNMMTMVFMYMTVFVWSAMKGVAIWHRSQPVHPGLIVFFLTQLFAWSNPSWEYEFWAGAQYLIQLGGNTLTWFDLGADWHVNVPGNHNPEYYIGINLVALTCLVYTASHIINDFFNGRYEGYFESKIRIA